ncbi:MAG: 30S ribosomal protein S1 [Desulfobacterales bacterium]|nr:30S ribosomal protein S1 [Desulfobacterales bacterium]
MSDNINDNNEEEENEESFADLLDSYETGMSDDIRTGDRIKGKIISIGQDTIFVDTGTKVDGAVEKSALLDENGELPYKVGDEVELFVVSNDENEVRLSKKFTGGEGFEQLDDAFRAKIPVEGKVKEVCKGGFRITLMGKLAFCPISQMDVNFVEKPEDYVGQTFTFIITKLEMRAKNVVVSRRKLLEAARKEEQEEFLKTLAVGNVYTGLVKKLMPFGAFVDIANGVDGLVHISELSWSRVSKPEDAVSVGDKIEVKVLSLEPKEKSHLPKISLSRKQVENNPWDSIKDNFKPGDKITGKITRCMNFGAFVEISPGIEGLVHVSEISYTKRITHPESVLTVGESISVVIKEVDAEHRRISLSIRDAEGDPWTDIEDNYTVGQTINGTVEKIEKFGYFISIAAGITGLLPKSKTKNAPEPAVFDKLKSGDKLSVRIDEIDAPNRKISLGIEGAAPDDWQSFTKDNTTTTSTMGSLGDLLNDAIKNKD